MSLKQKVRGALKAAVPAPLKPALRTLRQSLTDRMEIVRGERDALTPPKRMWHLVTDPKLYSKKSGEAGRKFLVETGSLSPDERVLDVGCGVGRQALALAGFLGEGGSYHGFDIMRDAIEWCQKNISRRYRNFHFHHADVRNEVYNPAGKYAAAEYRFPYADGSFDFVFLTSVFTHMFPGDVENYLREISRVTRPGGRCMISFYLLNDGARENIAAGKGVFDFKFDVGGCFAQFPEAPEAALAYEEGWARELFKECGFVIREPIIYGSWSHTKAQSQDIVIARIPAA